ncbi:MAG: hypothetical protein CME62_15690 [Halobacteriovoraceae bacterium]|nr:hypothetical protein [Halobacteriovoraceae bacterium]|tara:strand:+ start:7266 stop:8192 length:927 start_codon:yes stop_codon:yes gene_type:complete
MYKQIGILLILFISIGVGYELYRHSYVSAGKRIEQGALRDGYKICIVGDTGTGKKKQYAVAQALENSACDQIRILGDVIYPNGLTGIEDKQFEYKFLKPYKNLMESEVPFFINLGNHDYRGATEVWVDLAQRHELIKFPGYFWLEIYDDICFYNFDTNAYFIAQLRWLNSLEESHKGRCRLKFGFGHHPRYSVGHHGDAYFAVRTFLDRALKGFDAYFAGHDHHLSDEGVIEGTHHFISGAGGKLRSIVSPARPWAVKKSGFLELIFRAPENADSFFEFKFQGLTSEGELQELHSGEIEHQNLDTSEN